VEAAQDDAPKQQFPPEGGGGVGGGGVGGYGGGDGTGEVDDMTAHFPVKAMPLVRMFAIENLH